MRWRSFPAVGKVGIIAAAPDQEPLLRGHGIKHRIILCCRRSPPALASRSWLHHNNTEEGSNTYRAFYAPAYIFHPPSLS